VLLVHFEDFKHKKPEYRELYFELQHELKPVVDCIAGYYQSNGFIVRMLLAKLLAGGDIPNHTDAGYSLLNSHRVHIPIITNGKVVFVVGGEEKNMQVGEFWEINNGLDHSVENRSDEDRIHLIVDWMPNYAGKSEEAVLTADQPEETERAAGVAMTLNAMVAQAHQLHRSGRASKAESLYRQVLHMDSSHVLANNLLGLLCLQTKRFDEAVNYIERALAEMPDDAQAHSNLGLALKDLNRPEEAARHFHDSLKLVPNNPRVYNNLGSIYMSLGRIRDAITCFQQALAIQPAYPEVHFNLGNALLYLRRYSEAAASLQQCLALKPDFTEGRVKLEQALQGLRNK
jgi:tetratricopeptide (TPR) repeat protein